MANKIVKYTNLYSFKIRLEILFMSIVVNWNIIYVKKLSMLHFRISTNNFYIEAKKYYFNTSVIKRGIIKKCHNKEQL